MYTETIGRRILELWRLQASRPNGTAREYFDELFHPLFFDNEQYLLFANNSKFDQASKQKKKRGLGIPIRTQALLDHHVAVAELAERDQQEGHLYLGGYAAGVESGTSGMVSDIEVTVNAEAIYLTWLGQAAAIGVAGGLNVLVNDDIIIGRVVEGWSRYREYLQETPGLKALQVQTWNAWWLMASTSEYFKPNRPFDELASLDPTKIVGGKLLLSTAPWVKVLFALSSLLEESSVIAYVYSFGQTNTSVGFVQLRLNTLQELAQLYAQLFGKDLKHEARNRIKRLYDTDMGFLTACRAGSIGLQQLRPKGLRAILPLRTQPLKPTKFAPKQDQYQFHLTWLTAMLNNESLLQRADRLAASLLNFSGASKRAKKDNQTLVDKMLSSYTVRQFVDAATEIAIAGKRDEDAIDLDQLNDMVEEMDKLPSGQFPLFVTFLRFKYAYRGAK